MFKSDKDRFLICENSVTSNYSAEANHIGKHAVGEAS